MLPATDHRSRVKRSRVRLACLTCRDRKTRCDGRQPICKACETRGVGATCTYDRQQVQHLSNLSRHNEETSETQHTAQGQEVMISEGIPSATMLLSQPSEHNDPPSVVPVDALATVPTYTDLDRLYGPSSSIEFTRLAFETVESRQSTPVGARLRSSGRHRSPDLLWMRNEADATLPRRRLADDYLRGYWSFMHPVFPIVHKPTILRQYEELWKSSQEGKDETDTLGGTEETTFLATINIMFALGSKLSDRTPLATRREVADGFYQKSRKIYNMEVLDSSRLEAVQLLLLTAVYLQSSDLVERCWNVVGLAIRAAYGLNLHTENNSTSLLPQIELEMRRRVWYNCVSLDRLVSMTLGRPMMIRPNNSVPLPSTLDDEVLEGVSASDQPSRVLSQVSLFICSCRLFEVLYDILSIFYTTDISQQRPLLLTSTEVDECITNVLKLNKRIDMLEADVPDELRSPEQVFASSEPKHSTLYLQQQMYHCRMLYIRLLSLRPLLLQCSRGDFASQQSRYPNENSLTVGFARECCTSCTTTAYALVDTIHGNLTTPYGSPAWHVVYFTFASATVILASTRCHFTQVSRQSEKFKGAWAKCKEILVHHETLVPAASRAIRILTSINERLQSQLPSTIASQELSNINIYTGSQDTNTGSGNRGQNDPSDVTLYLDRLTSPWLNYDLNEMDWLNLPHISE